MTGHYKRYMAYLAPESVDRLKEITAETGVAVVRRRVRGDEGGRVVA